VEAVLLVSPRPVGVEDLASAVGLAAPEVRASLEELGRKYGAEGSGIVLREAGGGFLLATNPLCAPAVERFRREARPAPLSGAALEVLSCVLYLGPATRSAVSKVRGVNSDAVVRNLLDRGLLEEAGREGEGGPALLRVTEEFFVAADARDREDFAPLEDLVPPQALARLRERLGAAGPGFPTSPDTSATGDPASERRG
jgi:segregation and condensation protein B